MTVNMKNTSTGDLVKIHGSEDYGSEFEFDSEAEEKRKQRHDLASQKPAKKDKLPSRNEVTQEYVKEEGRTMRLHFLALDAYSRHKKLVNDYMLYYGGHKTHFQRDRSRDKRDIDIIKEHHKFLWDEDEDTDTWERRLAKKYYDKLFKEYCIADLSRYKENKIALRWRIDKEVVTGKGQFECGNKRCNEKEGLKTWEVNFAYVEQEEKKNALVKIRLCPDCSYKLNYHKKKREVKPKAKRKHRAPDEASASSSKKQKINDTNKDASENKGEDHDSVDPKKTEEEIWSGPSTVTQDKTLDDEFEEYLEDMFL